MRRLMVVRAASAFLGLRAVRLTVPSSVAGRMRAFMRMLSLLLAVALVALGATTTAVADAELPLARAAVVCSDHPNQAAAQRAADTRDSDGDGIYCETLACPCSEEWHAQHGDGGSIAPAEPPAARSCSRTREIVKISISRTRYPAVLAHMRTAIRAGNPEAMRLNRVGAERRRARALRGWKTRRGLDRDEYPMAFGRTSWQTHIAYVPARENRGAGATIGTKLRRWCDGVRFTIVGY